MNDLIKLQMMFFVLNTVSDSTVQSVACRSFLRFRKISCASVNAPHDSFFFSRGNLFWTKTHQFQFVFRDLNH